MCTLYVFMCRYVWMRISVCFWIFYISFFWHIFLCRKRQWRVQIQSEVFYSIGTYNLLSTQTLLTLKRCAVDLVTLCFIRTVQLPLVRVCVRRLRGRCVFVGGFCKISILKKCTPKKPKRFDHWHSKLNANATGVSWPQESSSPSCRDRRSYRDQEGRGGRWARTGSREGRRSWRRCGCNCFDTNQNVAMSSRWRGIMSHVTIDKDLL